MPKKNILWIILSIFLIVTLSCTKRPPARLHKNLEGFDDIKWGQDISTLEDMVCIKNKHPQQKVCTKKDESLKIGKVSLDAVEYYFWNDKFYGVVVTIKDYDNFKRLKKDIFKKFGRTEEREVYNGFGYSWDKEKTTIDLGYLNDFEKGTLSIELKDVAKEARQQIMDDLLKKAKR